MALRGRDGGGQHFLRQHPPGVIGEHHRGRIRKSGLHMLEDGLVSLLRRGRRGIAIHPQHLLPSRKDSCFGGVTAPGSLTRQGSIPFSASRSSRACFSRSQPAKPTTVTRAPSAARFMATLAAPPGTVPFRAGAHHGDGGLRRDAVNIAPEVAIQHDIADHQHRNASPPRFNQGQQLTSGAAH